MDRIKIGTKIEVYKSNRFKPVCRCTEIGTIINESGSTKHYTFTEIKPGREGIAHCYIYRNRKWYSNSPPINLSHDPSPEHYLEAWNEVRLMPNQSPKILGG